MSMRPNLFGRLAALASVGLLCLGCSSASTIGAGGLTSPTPITAPLNRTPVLITPLAKTPRAIPSPATAPAAPLTYSYQVVKRYPHDTAAWTEGLVYMGDDTLYESTGEYAQSSLREVRLSTGEVLRSTGLGDPKLYGEGISPVGDTVFKLTWQNCLGLLYHRADFTQYGQFSFPQASGGCAMEGWGLTYDGTQLIMSDGTSRLSFIDPAATIQSGKLAIIRQVQVTQSGSPVFNLNELEYINGAVFANVWLTNQIVRIDPATGQVTGTVDLSGLLSPSERASARELNGIAYDAAGDRLFVTGKYWPALFEIKLVPPFAYLLNMPLVAS
jgi:glutamine cyclotransferase